jgi:hypothetical protein
VDCAGHNTALSLPAPPVDRAGHNTALLDRPQPLHHSGVVLKPRPIGVELDAAPVVNAAGVQAEVRDARMHASPNRANSWWWD